MIQYPDGTDAMALDRVRTDHGQTIAVVEEVIETADEMRRWGLDEPGLMIDHPQYRLMFWPVDSVVANEIEFVSRGAIT